MSKLVEVVRRMPKRKSPGIDRYLVARLSTLLEEAAEEWLEVLNKCLKEKIFWKSGIKPIWISNVLTPTKNRRVLDKILASGLIHYLEVSWRINNRLLGFHIRRGTIQVIKRAVKQHKTDQVEVVFLDTKNSFISGSIF